MDNVASTTTVEEDRKTSGQRHVNLIWEATQAFIAISVTASMIYCAINQIESNAVTNAFILIISIYFVRMNHTKVGGVGAVPTDFR